MTPEELQKMSASMQSRRLGKGDPALAQHLRDSVAVMSGLAAWQEEQKAPTADMWVSERIPAITMKQAGTDLPERVQASLARKLGERLLREGVFAYQTFTVGSMMGEEIEFRLGYRSPETYSLRRARLALNATSPEPNPEDVKAAVDKATAEAMPELIAHFKAQVREQIAAVEAEILPGADARFVTVLLLDRLENMAWPAMGANNAG